MPKEIKQIRLPDSWNPGLNKEKISPRMYLNTINLDLPISGGWGYGAEDCVVIDKNDSTVNRALPFDGSKIEHAFVEKRIEAELVVSRQEDDIFRAITWDLSMQFLREIEGKKFDVLNVRVCAWTKNDYDSLFQEWKQNEGFKEDDAGEKEHWRRKHQMMCYYDTQYWFDITSYYGV